MSMVYLNTRNEEWTLVLNPYKGVKSRKTTPERMAHEDKKIANYMGISDLIVQGGNIASYIREVFRLRNPEEYLSNPIHATTEMHFITLGNWYKAWWRNMSRSEKMRVVEIYQDETEFNGMPFEDFESNKDMQLAIYKAAERFHKIQYPDLPMI